MKVFSVSNDCNACGECVLRTVLLTEDSGGYAVPVADGYIRKADLPEAEQIVAQCPVNALKIVEKSSVSSTGRAGLKELVQALEQRLKGISIPDISSSDIRYNEKEYTVDYGHIQGEGRAEYSSSYRAVEAGKSQFESVFWNHRKDFVMSVAIQYKSKVLRKYYDLSDPKRTFYSEIGRQMERQLKEIMAEAESLVGRAITFPESFVTFHPELDDEWFRKDTKEQYEKWIVTTSYVKDFCDRFERMDHHHKRDYEDRIYSLEDVQIVGKDWLGANKIKTMYSFNNANEVGKDLVEDIMFYLGYAKDCGFRDIDDFSLDHLNFLVDEYRKLVKKEISKKISEFKAAIGSF